MKNAALAVTFALAVCVTGSAAQAPPDEQIRRILTERLKGFEKSVGIVVGVIEPKGRRVIAHGSMGMNDPRPVDGDTLFEIGSITKVFTSLALADMIERGEVKLDDPLSKYLPPGVKAPARNGKEITLHDLSTHRSGLPGMPPDFNPPTYPLNPFVDYSVDRVYAFLSSYTLQREIGAEFLYSNLGAGLLGNALARRAGLDYEGLIRERILKPLGMSSTAISLSPALKSRMTTAHSSVYRLNPTPLFDIPAVPGAGALRSSTNDMLTFLAANLGFVETPLASSMAAMLKVRRDISENLKIGLGWRIETRQGMEIVWHGGASYGSRTFTGYDPKSRVGVVVLSNYNTGSGIDDIGRHILNPSIPFDDGSAVKPRDRTAVSIDPQLLDAYPGRYRFPDGEIFVVRRDGARFFLKKPSEPEFEIFPEGDFAKGNDDFFSKTLDALFTFDFDPASPGRASQMTFHWGFLSDRRAKRIE